MTTKHAWKRIAERVGLRDQRDADAFLKAAYEKGREPSFFPAGRLREYLDGKSRTGNRVVVHMGIVVVFAANGVCKTAYPLPSPLLDAYIKETKKHD